MPTHRAPLQASIIKSPPIVDPSALPDGILVLSSSSITTRCITITIIINDGGSLPLTDQINFQIFFQFGKSQKIHLIC